MKLKIFVVFHKALDQRLIFQHFSAAEIDDFFSLFAVNEAKYPAKRLTRLNGWSETLSPETPGVIIEERLAWHDPQLQARGFMETSCYVHVRRNALHAPFDYVGVAQYDMRWLPQGAATLRNNRRPRRRRRTRAAMASRMDPILNAQGQPHPWTLWDEVDWDFLLKSYNNFFGQSWDKSILNGKDLTLFQTYLLPRAQFEALADWLEAVCGQVYPWANEPPYPTRWGWLGGVTERAEAVFMAARMHEGLLSLSQLPLHHDPAIAHRLGITKDHYD